MPPRPEEEKGMVVVRNGNSPTSMQDNLEAREHHPEATS